MALRTFSTVFRALNHGVKTPHAGVAFARPLLLGTILTQRHLLRSTAPVALQRQDRSFFFAAFKRKRDNEKPNERHIPRPLSDDIPVPDGQKAWLVTLDPNTSAEQARVYAEYIERDIFNKQLRQLAWGLPGCLATLKHLRSGLLVPKRLSPDQRLKVFVRENTLSDGQKEYKLTFNCPDDFDPTPHVLWSRGVKGLLPLDNFVHQKSDYNQRHVPASVFDSPHVPPDKRLWMIHLKRGLTDHDAARLAELVESHINEPGMDPECPEHIVMVQYVRNGTRGRNYKLYFHYPAGQDPNLRAIEGTPGFSYWHGDAPLLDA